MHTTRVNIIDATLREGMQAPGVFFSADESEEIARILHAIGVDMIECGHPSSSEAHRTTVRRLSAIRERPPVLSHARCQKHDVQAVAACGAEWVGLFLGINEISRRTKLGGRSVQQLVAILEETITYARALGLRVRYTLEDGSRTNSVLRRRAFEAAVVAGADRICFADTVGVLEPEQVKVAVCELREWFPLVPIEVHLHDDRGLSTANALAAIDSGASWVSCSVNGLGERCGITDLVQLLANLHFRAARKLKSPEALQSLSRLVAKWSGSFVDPRRPISGEHAFHHIAHLHKEAMAVDDAAYNWIEPKIVGRKNTLAVTERSREALAGLACQRSVHIELASVGKRVPTKMAE